MSDAVAVFLGDSQLRGDAGPYSDIDFDVIVPGPREELAASDLARSVISLLRPFNPRPPAGSSVER